MTSRRGDRCDGCGVVPFAVSDDPIGFRRAPRIRFVFMNRRLVSKHRIDHAPRRFDGVFPYEEHRVATDGVAEQAFVRSRCIASHVTHEQLDAFAAQTTANAKRLFLK